MAIRGLNVNPLTRGGGGFKTIL